MSAAALQVIRHGHGPTIVLLHGFLASSEYWRPLIKAADDGFDMVAVDLLGFGGSPKPRRSRYGYDEHLTALDKTLRSNGITGPFILVGHSMGSLLAIRYARQHPRMVRGLVLFNPPLLKDQREARRTFLGNSLMYRLSLTTGVHRLVWPLYRLATYTRLLGSSLSQETEPFRSYLFQHTATSRLRSFRQLIVHGQGLDDLTRIEMPTMLVNSTDDRSIYRHNLTGIPHRSNMKVVTISGDHHVPLKRPTEALRLIKRFATDLDRRR